MDKIGVFLLGCGSNLLKSATFVLKLLSMHNKGFIILLISLFLASFAQAQRPNPYNLSWKVDAPVAGASIMLHTGYLFAKKRVNLLDTAYINRLNRRDIWKIDRSAAYNWSPKAAKVSDWVMFGCMASPALLLLDKKTHPNFGKISLIGLEVFALNTGLTNLTKALVHRTRPYNYNPNTPLSQKLHGDARMSFFSGHTSVSSSMCFYTAKVFHDYNPNSQLRPYVWATAAVVPAVTGYLRWRAGKHFFTDIVTGYLIGAAVGILVPELHRRFR